LEKEGDNKTFSKRNKERERESKKKRNNGRKFMVISNHDTKTFSRV
jgi:calcineurin-like phosphoesterase family protein